jgi:hypothetical protein
MGRDAMGCGCDWEILDGTGCGWDVDGMENIGRDMDVDVDVDVDVGVM